MSAQLTAQPIWRLYDNSGKLAIGGEVYTYIAGTTTPIDTFTDESGTTPNTNPIVANARGEFQLWLADGQAYKLVALDALGNALWTVDNLTGAGGAATALALSLAATTGADLVGYQRGQVYQRGTLGYAIQHLLPNLKTDFGAECDGVTDDTAAWQAALDAQVWFNVPPGVTLAHELKWKVGSRVYGAGCWSTNTPTDENTSTTVLKYNGAGGLNSYIALLSTAAIGANPTTPLQNVACNGIHFDGADLAEIGRMDWRAWAGNDLDNCSFGNCRKTGLLAINCWDKGPRALSFYRNRGPGFILAEDYFGLSLTFAVDEVTLIDWFTYGNGCDQSGNPYNVFADTGGTAPTSANVEAEAGGVVYGGRHLRFINFQAAQNSGPALVVNTPFHPVIFDGGYMEANGRSSGASRAWCTWTVMRASSFNIEFGRFFFGSPSPAHRITGVGVFRVEQSPRFHDCAILGEMVVDAGILYRLENCDRLVADGGSLVITGQAPTNFDRQRGAFRSMGTSGVAVFDATSGAIVMKLKQGVISGVTRSAAGVYVVAFSEVYTGANYGIRISGGDGCEVGSTTILNNGFTVGNRVAGVLSDTNARITVEVIGDYD